MSEHMNDDVEVIATHAYRTVKEIVGLEDLYVERKESERKMAYEIREELEAKLLTLNEGFERFRFTVLCAAYANLIDPGVADLHVREREIIEKIESGFLSIDHTRRLFSSILRSKSIVFVPDNNGEAVIDLMLLRELKRLNKSLEIKVIAKSKPFQNDLTVDEAYELGFHRYGKILGTGSDAGGIIRGMVNKKVTRILEKAELVLAKGMANYESLSSWNINICYILTAKCDPIARAFSVKKGTALVYLSTRV